MGLNPKEFTYVDAEEPEFRGMLKNPLPDFWCDDLSKAWAGVNNLERNLFTNLPLPIAGYHKLRGWHADDSERRIIYPVTPEMEKRAKVVEEHPFENSGYVIMEDAQTSKMGEAGILSLPALHSTLCMNGSTPINLFTYNFVPLLDISLVVVGSNSCLWVGGKNKNQKDLGGRRNNTKGVPTPSIVGDIYSHI